MGWLQRVLASGRIVACSALLAACAQIHNEPINQPLVPGAGPNMAELGNDMATYYDDTVIALSFSGGGTRAAAFSYGVLTALDQTPTPNRPTTLLDRVDFVTGVSGGSVLAAYYGLKKRQALADFKQRFLLRNAQAELDTSINLINIAKGLQGGINGPNNFSRWLDDNLFEHATFKSLMRQRRPLIWINASDIYNRTPFVFGRVLFGALCSDLSNYPVSLAVAASAAVPVFFTPIVVQNFTGACPTPLPDWVPRVLANPDAPPMLRLFANALERYHSGEVRYVKLLDGGIVDNYGLAGLTIARLASFTPYGPLEPEEGVKLRRMLFLVVDAGRAPSGRLGEDRRRPGRGGAHHCGFRYGNGVGGGRQLFRISGYDQRLAAIAHQLAVQALRSRSPPLRRAAELELPRRQAFGRPHCVRSARSATRRRAQRCRDQLRAAAAAGGSSDRCRARRAAAQSGIPHFPQLAGTRRPAPRYAGCHSGRPRRGSAGSGGGAIGGAFSPMANRG